MIIVDNLSVHFKQKDFLFTAVNNVSFEVKANEVLGLVGESGSGKSTILRAITGLNPNWQGNISIDNTPVSKSPDKSFYKKVQMVFQDPYASLHPKHTIHSILKEPLQIHGIDEQDLKISEVLERVQLDQRYLYRYPHQLSGGQRQRVAIARALLLEPKILLLDEPTSALDVSIQAEILNLFMVLRQTMDLTCIFVSHDLSVVAHICDKVAVMQHGEIVEVLSSDDLDNNHAKHAYTSTLINAAKGYVPKNKTQ